MLLSEYAEVKWNPHNKKYYENKGYEYTKMNDIFLVKVEDLTKGSSSTVKVKCDYCEDGCKDISDVRWADYVKIKNRNVIDKDCCSNRKCMESKNMESNSLKYGCSNTLSLDTARNKIKQTNIERYGCENPFASDVIKEKIKNTNIEKYGCEYSAQNHMVKQKIKNTNIERYGVENPFSSEQIKEKIRKTNLEKYGVEVPTQNPEIRAKGTRTCIEKYGVENYGAIYSSEHKGELSPTWKGGVEFHRVERSTYEYRHWRKNVFERDGYVCQCCGDTNGFGHRVDLVAHHIMNWKDNVDLRYDVDNGVTLCEKCHLMFHSKYGKRNNTFEQLKEFLNLDKKVC